MDADPIATLYEPVEHFCFGRALESRRFAFLQDLNRVERAITCGEGDGRFLAALLRSNPHVQVTAVDVSWKMTQIGNRRISRMEPRESVRAEYVCADVGTFAPAQPCDLIATHFFLDCFSTEDAARVIRRVAGWATPQARWIISEFTQPPGTLGRLWSGAIIRSLYAGFRVTTGLRTTHLPDYLPALASAGFELRKQLHAFSGLLVSELWERS